MLSSCPATSAFIHEHNEISSKEQAMTSLKDSGHFIVNFLFD